MTYGSQINFGRKHQFLVTGLVLGISLGGMLSAFAGNGMPHVATDLAITVPMIQPQKNYVPPPPGDSPSGSTSGGVRGRCSDSSDLSFLTLAPHSHVGQTSSTHPTFAWFVPDSISFELVFQLFEGDLEDPLYDISLPSQAGVMTWSLPEHEPGLEVGKTYRWRVIMICNPNRPSLSVRDEAQLRVVEPPEGATSVGYMDLEAYVNQMAALGFWYDALAASLSDTNSDQLRSLRLELLNDLAQLESTTDPQRADSLQRIANIEQ